MPSRRALNRATLSRQLLLERHELPAADVVTHLAGMQAQAPLAPYIGLWTRLAGFDPGELSTLVADRTAVRAALMRGTVHLVTAADLVAFRPLVQPVLERAFWAQAFGKHLAGLDVEALLAAARELVEAEPLTRPELGRLLGERWPDRDADSLAYAVTYLETMVQVPPRGLWGGGGAAMWTTARSWLDIDGSPGSGSVGNGSGSGSAGDGSAGDGSVGDPPSFSVDDLVRRYLGAFGPATVKDVQTWSGLTRLREVVDRMRSELVELRGDDGAELFDLPDAPRPDEDTPAPVRFIPAYDNLLLSHADRSRVIGHDRRVPLPPGNGDSQGTVLVDGEWRADWRIVRPARSDAATLEVTVFPEQPAPPADDRAALETEGAALLALVAPDRPDRSVRLA